MVSLKKLAFLVLVPSLLWAAPAAADSPLTEPKAHTEIAKSVGYEPYAGNTSSVKQATVTIAKALEVIKTTQGAPDVAFDVAQRVDSVILDLPEETYAKGPGLLQKFHDGLEKLESEATNPEAKARYRLARGVSMSIRDPQIGAPTVKSALRALPHDPRAQTVAALSAGQNERWKTAASLMHAATHNEKTPNHPTTQRLIKSGSEYMRLYPAYRRAAAKLEATPKPVIVPKPAPAAARSGH